LAEGSSYVAVIVVVRHDLVFSVRRVVVVVVVVVVEGGVQGLSQRFFFGLGVLQEGNGVEYFGREKPGSEQGKRDTPGFMSKSLLPGWHMFL